MIEIAIKVDIDGESHTAKTNGWTVIQWERKTKQKYAVIAQQGLGLEDMYLLAHIALKDANVVVPDFDRFCKLVTNIEVEVDEANPTNGER